MYVDPPGNTRGRSFSLTALNLDVRWFGGRRLSTVLQHNYVSTILLSSILQYTLVIIFINSSLLMNHMK